MESLARSRQHRRIKRSEESERLRPSFVTARDTEIPQLVLFERSLLAAAGIDSFAPGAVAGQRRSRTPSIGPHAFPEHAVGWEVEPRESLFRRPMFPDDCSAALNFPRRHRFRFRSHDVPFRWQMAMNWVF